MTSRQRWTVLTFSCFSAFTSNFFSDIVSSLSRRLQGSSIACAVPYNQTLWAIKPPDRCYDFSNIQYNSLTTGITYASGVTAVLAALLIGHYGQRSLLLTSSFLILCGSLVFVGGSYVSTTAEAYGLLLIGRIIYGAGNGIRTTVAGYRLDDLWKGNLPVHTSYILSSRLGSALSFAIAGATLNPLGMSKTIWIAVGMSMASVFTSCLQGVVDVNDHLLVVMEDESTWGTSKRRFADFGKEVRPVYWFFAMTYLLVFCIITTLTGNGAGLLASLTGITEVNAIWIVGSVYYFSLLIPLVNFLVYLTGRRDYWMTGGTVIIMSGLVAYLSSMAVQTYLMTILIGLGFVLFDPTASDSMSLVAPPGTQGFATGLLKFLRYTGTGTVALIVGAVLDREQYIMMDSIAWRHMIIFFLVLSVVAVVTSLCVVWANYRSRDRLLTIPEEKVRKRPWEVTLTENHADVGIENLDDSGESTRLIQSFSSRGKPMNYASINSLLNP